MNKSLKKQFFYKNRFSFGIIMISSILISGTFLMISWLLQQLIDTASHVPGARTVKELGIITLALICIYLLLSLLDCILRPKYMEKALNQYKSFAFDRIMKKSLASFREESESSYLSMLTNDVTAIETDYLENLTVFLTKVFTCAGAFLMMILYSPLLTLISVLFSLLPLIVSLVSGSRIAKIQKNVSDRNEDFTATLKDCLSGFSVIKTFKAEKEIIKLLQESSSRLEHEKSNRRRLTLLIMSLSLLMGSIAQMGVFFAGVILSLSGRGITPGTIMVFVQLMNYMIQPAAELPGLIAKRKAADTLIDKLEKELNKNQNASEGRELRMLSHGIELKNVSFAYDEQDVLHDISLSLEAGKSYAIVGSSGSGKSTLLNLLTPAGRDSYKGSITLDGVELRDISVDSLYNMESMVQQNVFVFNSSIKDNITMFGNFDNAEVERSVKIAHLDKLLEEKGSDYLCGENGKELSGGEKQRISIARGILKESSLILADEITSALDPETARSVSSDILDLADVTRVVVTHSPEEALLRRYDEIIVMKNGRIVETGDFDSLKDRCGFFQEFLGN